MQFSNLGGMHRRSGRPTETFAVLPRMFQARQRAFPQNLTFELSEYSEQAGHGATRRGGQIQCLCQGNEPDTQVFQLLERRQQIRYRPTPAVQPPHQDQVDLPATRGVQQPLASFPFCRAGVHLTDL